MWRAERGLDPSLNLSLTERKICECGIGKILIREWKIRNKNLSIRNKETKTHLIRNSKHGKTRKKLMT